MDSEKVTWRGYVLEKQITVLIKVSVSFIVLVIISDSVELIVSTSTSKKIDWSKILPQIKHTCNTYEIY